MEALEAGSRLLLLDEDTCATNFMVRDELMGALVEDSAEPSKPLVGSVRALVEARQTATLALLLPHLVAELREGTPLAQASQQAVKELEAQGFTGLGAPRGDLVIPRPYELAAAVNRLRVS